MEKIDTILFENIGKAMQDLPLNYGLAQQVFKNKKLLDSSTTIRFISIKKYETKKGIVTSFHRPISKCLQLNSNET